MYAYNGTRLGHPLAEQETETFADIFSDESWERFFELVWESLQAWREIFWMASTICTVAFLIWAFMR